MGSFSIWHWLIVLVIVMLVFGTKKLRNVGEDLGSAVKGFKEGLQSGEGERGSARLAANEAAGMPTEARTPGVADEVRRS